MEEHMLTETTHEMKIMRVKIFRIVTGSKEKLPRRLLCIHFVCLFL